MPRLLVYFYFLTSIFISQNSYSQLISYDTHIRIEDGRKITEKKLVVLINDKSDFELAHIEIPSSKSQNFELIEAKILNEKGNRVKKLKNNEIRTRSLRTRDTFYQDNEITSFRLYWKEYPYRIEYSYRLTESNFLHIADWKPVHFLYDSSKKSSLKVDIPFDFNFNMSDNSGIEPVVHIKNGYQSFLWEIKNSKLPKAEKFAPPLNELIPHVNIVPHEFQLGVKGSAKTWSGFGEWQFKLNKDTDELPNSEKEIVDDLIMGISEPQMIVKKLFEYMQDKNTYVNVAIDIGGFKSFPASYVCKNRYGDCKALTTYMKAMLKYVGIESYYTLIGAGENRKRVDTSLPGQQFNHVILAVPFENDTIWLENTTNFLPFNYMGTFMQNRFGLAVIKDDSKLIKTPALDISSSYDLISYNYKQGINENWKLSIDMEFSESINFERILHELKEGRRESLRNFLYDEIPITGFELSDFSIYHKDRGEHNLKVNSEGIIKSPISEYGQMKVIQPIKVELPEMEDLQDRKHPVRVNVPINKTIKNRYYVDYEDAESVEFPEKFEIENKFGKYQLHYVVKNNVIESNENFRLYSGDYILEEYSLLLDFFNKVNQIQKSSAIIIK